MEKELTRKIAWLEKRHEEMHLHVEMLEADRNIDRSPNKLFELKQAKKEKLRLKDHVELLKKLQLSVDN